MTAIIFLVLRILLSICIYAFILVLFYYLWNENRLQGNFLSNRRIPSICLEIHADGSPDLSQYFDSDEISIGRDANCDVKLSDENVSNHHARLRYHHAQWWLEDLGSRNGTLLNDQPLLTPVVVMTGDEIKCGLHTLSIKISGELQIPTSKKFIFKDNGGENE